MALNLRNIEKKKKKNVWKEYQSDTFTWLLQTNFVVSIHCPQMFIFE